MQKYVKLFWNIFIWYVLDIWHTSCPVKAALLELKYLAYASCGASQILIRSQNIALFLCKNFMFNNELFSSIDDSFVDNCLFSKQSATLSKCSFVRATCISFFCQCFEVKQFCAGVSGPFISRGDAHEWLSCLQWSAFKLPSGKCLLVSLCRVRNSKAGARTIAYWSSIDIARFTETDL